MSRALLFRCFLLLCLSVTFLPGASGCGGGGGNDDGGNDNGGNTTETGCLYDSDCGAGMTCNVEGCGSEASGTCVVASNGCNRMLAPVCGCDGETYSNDCTRQVAGAALAHDGACVAQDNDECGGALNIECAVGLLCDYSQFEDNSCPAEMTGFCRSASQPMSFCDRGAPVECGCDGTLYANGCTRSDAGVARAATEFCQPGGFGNNSLND